MREIVPVLCPKSDCCKKRRVVYPKQGRCLPKKDGKTPMPFDDYGFLDEKVSFSCLIIVRSMIVWLSVTFPLRKFQESTKLRRQSYLRTWDLPGCCSVPSVFCVFCVFRASPRSIKQKTLQESI